jgi:hypothetical protein
MKRLYLSLLSTSILFSISEAAAVDGSAQNQPKNKIFVSKHFSETFSVNSATESQQNLIGEVTNLDSAAGRITLRTEGGASVTISFNDKTIFRRVLPGQTSIANAEQVSFGEIKVGDRILVPGGAQNEQTAVRQIIVMPRAAISAQRDQEAENRRARTVNGRVLGVNLQNREITIQTRAGDSGLATVVVAVPENAKLLRYASDSLRVSDAVAGSFEQVSVGDQIRIVGDRNTEGTRITAEEIVSGAFTRTMGTIVEVNQARNEITVRNNETKQIMTVALGPNSTLRRIPDDVAATLRQRMGQRQGGQAARQNQTDAANRRGQGQQNRRQNRGEGRPAQQAGQGNRGNQLLGNLPAVTIAELKKGDAILITGSGSAEASRLTAVSIITGDPALQQFLMRMGGGTPSSPSSPGLPGNISGGNTIIDIDEPRN